VSNLSQKISVGFAYAE